MRIATVAASLAVLISATGIAAVSADRSVPHYPATPARAHSALGPVQILAAPQEEPATLAEAARARYGDFDALTQVRTTPLPWSDQALVTGTAIRWN